MLLLAALAAVLSVPAVGFGLWAVCAMDRDMDGY